MNQINRRRFLQIISAATLLGIASCGRRLNIYSTFLQLWPDHANLKRNDWRKRLNLLYELGYREIIVQWIGKEGGTESWSFPEESLAMVFDEAESLGMGMQIGLPHDDRWNEILRTPDLNHVPEFFLETLQRCESYMATAQWPERTGFRGWYIPYEIEQHSWSPSAKQNLLVAWLDKLSKSAFEHSGIQPGISTYFSKLKSEETLEGLWAIILNKVEIRPMIQDGVGVAGLEGYRSIAALHSLLRERHMTFDLIVELFEEQPSKNTDGTTFKAISADFSRVKQQLDIAENYGANNIVAFAADPWLIGPSPEAVRLLADWRAANSHWGS
ncbi:DUF4434 domain-containing protein [Alcaligenaceae bacterium]|nr:DUF4434 domain-containing protein [Alcaligenaceae bacterium]